MSNAAVSDFTQQPASFRRERSAHNLKPHFATTKLFVVENVP
jgi:hypothetical protein